RPAPRPRRPRSSGRTGPPRVGRGRPRRAGRGTGWEPPGRASRASSEARPLRPGRRAVRGASRPRVPRRTGTRRPDGGRAERRNPPGAARVRWRRPPSGRRSGPCAARAGASGPRDVLLAPGALLARLLASRPRTLGRRVLQRLVEDLVHRLHEGEVQGPTHVFGDVLEVLLVPPRQDHALDAGAPGGEHLLLDAADRQDLAAQGDLAGHGKVRTDRAARSEEHTS